MVCQSMRVTSPRPHRGIVESADGPPLTIATRPEAENDTRAELTDSNLAGEDTASSEG